MLPEPLEREEVLPYQEQHQGRLRAEKRGLRGTYLREWQKNLYRPVYF